MSGLTAKSIRDARSFNIRDTETYKQRQERLRRQGMTAAEREEEDRVKKAFGILERDKKKRDKERAEMKELMGDDWDSDAYDMDTDDIDTDTEEEEGFTVLETEPTERDKIEQGEVYTQADVQREKDRKFFASLMTDEESEYFRQERIEQLADAPDEPYEDEYGSIPYQIRKLKEEFGGDEWGFTGTPPHKIYDGVVYFFEEETERLYDVDTGEDIGAWDSDGKPANWDTEEDEAQHKQNIMKYTLGTEKK